MHPKGRLPVPWAVRIYGINNSPSTMINHRQRIGGYLQLNITQWDKMRLSTRFSPLPEPPDFSWTFRSVPSSLSPKITSETVEKPLSIVNGWFSGVSWPLIIMRSLIVAHSVRSFFSTSHPKIRLGTFSTASTSKISRRRIMLRCQVLTCELI